MLFHQYYGIHQWLIITQPSPIILRINTTALHFENCEQCMRQSLTLLAGATSIDSRFIFVVKINYAAVLILTISICRCPFIHD